MNIIENVYKKIKDIQNTRMHEIDIDKVLRGSEGDIMTGIQYVQMTGDKFRTSTRVIQGPQAFLIKDYLEIGEKIFTKDIFENTWYYKNALECIDYLNNGYFQESLKPEDVIISAKRYVDSFLERDISLYPSTGHQKYSDKIIVRPIFNSDHYQIVSGNHRLVSHYLKGKTKIEAVIRTNQITDTYFTKLFKEISWDKGSELYQPIGLPEFSNLPLIRATEDRFIKMINFLRQRNIEINKKSLIDIGSYFGWFQKKFLDLGCRSYGLERDFTSIKMSIDLYDLPNNLILHQPLEQFILRSNAVFDISIFLSVFHHFVLKNSYLNPIYVLKNLADRTNQIMFFETGEEHEKMFNGALEGWNVDYIKDFVLKNTSFTEVIELGRDNDNKGKYANNYKRMLFAFLK